MLVLNATFGIGRIADSEQLEMEKRFVIAVYNSSNEGKIHTILGADNLLYAISKELLQNDYSLKLVIQEVLTDHKLTREFSVNTTTVEAMIDKICSTRIDPEPTSNAIHHNLTIQLVGRQAYGMIAYIGGDRTSRT